MRYALHRTHWGRGLAAEALIATLDDAFTEAGLERVVSIVQAGNAASHRVMAKLGFDEIRRDGDGDIELVVYAMPHQRWPGA